MMFEGLAKSSKQIGLKCEGEIMRRTRKVYNSNDKNDFTIHESAECIIKSTSDFKFYPHCENK